MNLRRMACFGLGIVFLAVVVTLISVSKETTPTVNGLAISKWLRSSGGRYVGQAAEAGTNAIPCLARLARAHDLIPYNWSIKAWSALPRSLRLKVRPPVAASEVRSRALEALGGFGSEAERELAVVIRAATNDTDLTVWNCALRAAVAIDAYHPQVLALLERDLRSSDPVVRGSAMAAFWNTGICPRAVTNLILLDPHDKNQIFLEELLVLSVLGSDAAPFVPRIVPFLADDSTRMNALIALQRVGPGGIAAVPALIACLRSPETKARPRAAAALMDIGAPATDAVPALETAMRDQELATRVLAAIARWRITGDPSLSAPVIFAALQAEDDGSPWILPQGTFGLFNFAFNGRQTALWFAGELGPAAREMLPVLITQMGTGSDWYRILAARSVWKIEGSPQRSLPVLQSCLNNRDENVRILACHILGEIGPPAAPLLRDLAAAQRTTLATRRAAMKAIKAIHRQPG